MKSIASIAAAAAVAVGLATPVFAAEPARLTDAQLDQVTGGEGALIDAPIDVNLLLKDISVVVNISNVPVNVGAAVQANVLGQALQTATVTAGQMVQQVQYIQPLPGH